MIPNREKCHVFPEGRRGGNQSAKSGSHLAQTIKRHLFPALGGWMWRGPDVVRVVENRRSWLKLGWSWLWFYVMSHNLTIWWCSKIWLNMLNFPETFEKIKKKSEKLAVFDSPNTVMVHSVRKFHPPSMSGWMMAFPQEEREATRWGRRKENRSCQLVYNNSRNQRQGSERKWRGNIKWHNMIW